MAGKQERKCQAILHVWNEAARSSWTAHFHFLTLLQCLRKPSLCVPVWHLKIHFDLLWIAGILRTYFVPLTHLLSKYSKHFWFYYFWVVSSCLPGPDSVQLVCTSLVPTLFTDLHGLQGYCFSALWDLPTALRLFVCNLLCFPFLFPIVNYLFRIIPNKWVSQSTHGERECLSS